MDSKVVYVSHDELYSIMDLWKYPHHDTMSQLMDDLYPVLEWNTDKGKYLIKDYHKYLAIKLKHGF